MNVLYTPKQEQTAIDYFNKLEINVNEGMDNLDKLLGKNLLIKIGGDCLDNYGYDSIGEKLADLYTLDIKPTIVHGGSSQISRIMDDKGIPIVEVNGLRTVPDQATLDAVVEGLTYVNNRLVEAVNYHAWHHIAVGLKDEKIVYAEKSQPIIDEEGKKVDLGFVGVVTGFDANAIDSYIEEGKIPILWCIGYGEDGQQYNINADHVGEALASNYDKYIILTSVGGYKDEKGEIVSEMTLEQAEQHEATEGMAIKLDSVTRVLGQSKKLRTVQITSPKNLLHELFLNQGSGTIIKK